MSEKNQCFWWKFLDGMMERIIRKVSCILGPCYSAISWQHTFTQMHQYCFQPGSIWNLWMGKHWRSIFAANLTTDGFSHTKTVVGWCDTKTNPRVIPAFMKWHAFFWRGEIKLDAHVVLVILEGLPWKIVHGVYEVLATKFHPETWGRWTQVDYGAIFFFRWVGKKHPATRFGLVSSNDEAIRIFWGKLLATSGSCSVDLGPSWYQQFFSTISEDGAPRGAAADGWYRWWQPEIRRSTQRNQLRQR